MGGGEEEGRTGGDRVLPGSKGPSFFLDLFFILVSGLAGASTGSSGLVLP
jgi:hypothetical protein